MADALWMDVGNGALVGATAPMTEVDDRVTIIAHGLADGEPVILDNVTGGAVGVLRPGVLYWVWNTTTDDFQVAPSAGAPVMTIDADATVDVYRPAALQTATELRRLASALMAPGDGGLATKSGVRPGNVPASTSGFTLTVHDCSGLVQAVGGNWAANDGPYQWAATEQELTITAADGAQTRFDRLVMRIQDDAIDGSGFLQGVPVIKDGTPGSGSAPAAGPGEVELGVIEVAAGGSPAPDLTLAEEYCWGLGAVETYANSGALPSVGRYDGQYTDLRDAKTLYRDTGTTREAIASVENHAYVEALTDSSQALGWNIYVPTVTGGGTATFSTQAGRWKRFGPFAIAFIVYLVVSSAGSGSSNVQISMPTDINRATRQIAYLGIEGAAGGGGGNRDGHAVAFTSQSGPQWDRLRFTDGVDSHLDNMVGSDLASGMFLTLQGFYQAENI